MTQSAVKTAVVGARGYIGRHLLRAYREIYPDCVGTTSSPEDDQTLQHFDLTDPKLDVRALEDSGHRAVLIAAAKPNIGYCEQHKEDSFAVNVRGTLWLIDQVARTSMQVIFLSSDYVFDGAHGGYDDDVPTRPTTEYGRQKAEVERELPNRASDWLVLRLSKIFGVEKRDGTLCDEMAAALSHKQRIRAAVDQRFCPTLMADLVTASMAAQSRGLHGIVNTCGPVACSRYDLAKELLAALRVDEDLIEPVSLHDLPGMRGRPLDTSMICSRLSSEAGAAFTPLDDSVRRIAANWSNE